VTKCSAFCQPVTLWCVQWHDWIRTVLLHLSCHRKKILISLPLCCSALCLINAHSYWFT